MRKKIEKIYLSGKISGLPKRGYEFNFQCAAEQVVRTKGYGGYEIVSPLDITPFLWIKTWLCFMIADIFELLQCDTIFMLYNWKDSRGARIEFAIAVLSGKKIMFQDEKHI